MRKISRITTQKRNKERYNVFLTSDKKQDYYGFSVDEAVLIQYMLKKGMEIDDALLESILQQDTLYEAYTRAIHFLSYRMRSQKEVRDFLLKKEVEEDLIEEVMDRLIDEKLVDDREFAKMFIRTRISTSDKGPQYVRKELAEKGVAAHLIDETINELYTDEVQFEKARKLVEKKSRQGKIESHFKQIQRIENSLLQKGYSRHIVQEAIHSLEKNVDEDAEAEALRREGDRLIRRFSRTLEGYELRQKVQAGLYRKGFSLDRIHEYLEDVLQ